MPTCVCPHCKATMACPPDFAGKPVACSMCDGHFTVGGGVAAVNSPALPTVQRTSPSRSTSSVSRRGPVMKYEGLLVTFAGIGCACLVILVMMGFAWELRYQKFEKAIEDVLPELDDIFSRF